MNLDTTCRHRMVAGSCIDCGWTRPKAPYTGPALTITKVESGWYTYEICVGGVVTIGHGSRTFVKQAVDEVLTRANRPRA